MAKSESRVMMSVRPRGTGLAVLFGWLLPGAGHWYLGLNRKALLFCLCLLSMFGAGMIVGYGRAVDPGHHWVLFIAQICAGPVALLGWAVGLSMDPGVITIAPRLVDLGMVFTVVAGALNAIVMSDAYALAAHLKRETAPDDGVQGGFDG